MTGAGNDLQKESITAFLWGIGGAFARIVLTLGTQIVLARLLGPAEYGLFALGVVVVMLSSYFSDVGLAYGLIQKPTVSPNDIRFVWTWQWILGLAVAGALFAGAGELARFFAKPDSETMFRWLAIVTLINALTAPSTNLLKKNLNYKALQLAQLCSYFLGYVCIGIPLAYHDYGSSALVASWLVQSTTSFAILYAYVRHPVLLKFWTAGGGKMLSYGATVFATNLINWVLTTADKALIGRLFPTHTVGLYTTAFNLVNSPTAAIYGNLQSVVFSASARLQDNSTALKGVYLRLLAAIFVVVFPLFAIVGINAQLVIAGIYGPQWAEAVPFLRIFALVMPFLLVLGISTPVLWNSGHTKLELWLQLPMVLVWIAVLYGVSSAPAQTVAFAVACLFVARCSVMALAAAYVVQLPARSLLRAIRGGLLMTLLMASGAALVSPALAGLDVNAPTLLLITLLTNGLGYLLCLVALAPAVMDKQLASFVASQSHRLPHTLDLLVRLLTRRHQQ